MYMLSETAKREIYIVYSEEVSLYLTKNENVIKLDYVQMY